MLKNPKLLAKENKEQLEKTASLRGCYKTNVKENNQTTDTRYVGKVGPKHPLDKLGRLGIDKSIVGLLVVKVYSCLHAKIGHPF